MKTCEDCKYFEKDEMRSNKLGEPLGTCTLEHHIVIGNFDAYEKCDGYDSKPRSSRNVFDTSCFEDFVDTKFPMCSSYTTDRWRYLRTKWCVHQEVGEDNKLMCLAHLSEDRIFNCPYADADDRRCHDYPCSDYKPEEIPI